MLKSNLELQAERNRAARIRNGLVDVPACWCGAPPEGSPDFRPTATFTAKHSRERRLPSCEEGKAADRLAKRNATAAKKLALV